MKAVQYGDTVVYVEDLKSLGKHQWLGDRVISFYFEFLQNEVYPEYPAICFVSPVVVQLIGSLTVPTEVEQFVSAMCLDERDLILLPLNNNIDYSMAAGGSHWSLLVFDRREHVFTHYDSMRHNNWKPAVDLVNKLHPSLDRYAEIIKATCPQQRNGSDCGMYAMVFAAEVAQAFADNRKPDLDCATPSFVDAKRKNLYDLIIQIGKPCDNIRVTKLVAGSYHLMLHPYMAVELPKALESFFQYCIRRGIFNLATFFSGDCCHAFPHL